jgi:hypothetical protein
MATSSIAASPSSTRTLLTAGAVGAPLWAAVSLVQAATRQGFDPTRHPLSLLSNGAVGGLQITNFVLAGVLAVAAAVGLRRALAGTAGAGWAPRLVAAYGVGMIVAGPFRLDPGDGFPAGTPAGPATTLSWHGGVHLLAGAVSFAALAAACWVLARHFRRAGRRPAAITSLVAGGAVVAGNAWSMAGGAAGPLLLAIGTIAGMLWIAAVCADLRRTA